MPETAEIDMAGLRAVLELMAEAGELNSPLPDVASFVEPAYLKAAMAK